MRLFKRRRPEPRHSVWHDSLQVSQWLGFAATEMPELNSAPLLDPTRAFDVCHVGLVLRAVLGVQLLLGLGAALVASNFWQWLMLTANGTVVTLFAVLSWLLIVCAAKRLWPRLPEPAQWLALMGLGAATAISGFALLNLAGDEPALSWRWGSVAATGASGAAMLLAWLKLRERSQRPADALAQLVELQSRIRPHFLFNTLNSAIALVQIDPARAEGVLEDLAELFRVALADASASVTLGEEIELARRYLAIEQIRFGRRLCVVWHLDPEADAARVPPLLLQPLVENAVRHGVEPNDEGGEIEVTTARRGTEVEIRVINTVGGPARTAGHGLALRNVRQRLRLMHDVAARFDIEAVDGRFSVHIVVPA
ncbi:sensor histidine kinase [Roseateles saccharophilus]|uniref:Two-component system sensor histidine kinase AlgZ n=1 Tax=Roseateles saccharophilus TaxID=304 RepID=A0A4V2VQ07_ROSSA|nr:histidine kinase [Roseateles saccharophilus]MDG0835503.1 sensor histidine kinase [Roseateles saccharophilus]TCU92689.1 two-component system sensor histidine kinase AlgZ [Roseateles saccharophilus]